jgi:hypothetical protein
MMFKPGDYVLHYADEKHPKMLMVVRGYVGDLVRTRYVHHTFWGKFPIHNLEEDFLNDEKNLKLASEYNINPEVKPDDFERVRLWNYYWPVGSVVQVSGFNGFITKTTSEAWLENNKTPMIRLEHYGRWLLEFISPYKEAGK